ncbi:FkbM family methyltransferase [Thauera mechernichensis]
MLLRVWRHPVNRADLPGAMARMFAHWVTCRLAVGAIPLPLPFANDTWLFCERRSREAAGLRLLVLKDFAAMSFVAHYLRPAEHFVDVGAGVGSYTVLAAAVTAARVTAFEPAEAAAAALMRNVAFNELAGLVKCRRIGVSDASGRGYFPPAAGGRLRADPCAEGEGVVRLQRLDEALGDDVAQVLKVDVCGDELEVLRGAQLTLQRPGLDAVIVGTGRGCRGLAPRWHRVCALLERHGFEPADYDPFERRLLRPAGLSDKGLFVRGRRADAIMRRVERAEGFWPTEDLCV